MQFRHLQTPPPPPLPKRENHGICCVGTATRRRTPTGMPQGRLWDWKWSRALARASAWRQTSASRRAWDLKCSCCRNGFGRSAQRPWRHRCRSFVGHWTQRTLLLRSIVIARAKALGHVSPASLPARAVRVSATARSLSRPCTFWKGCIK